jgi:putative NADH-flavin reductase
MKLFVIGATGRTGGEVVQQALAPGSHGYCIFVRSPEGIHLKNERLKIVKGEVTDKTKSTRQQIDFL